MKRVLNIGHNDVRLFFKSKSAYVWLFIIPTMFVYFMGFAMRGPGDPYNRRPALVIENRDTNFLATAFLNELSSEGIQAVEPTNAANTPQGIRIRSEFTERVLRGERTPIEFYRKEGAGEADGALAELRLIRALIGINSHLLEAVTKEGSLSTLTSTRLSTISQEPNPVKLDARFAGRRPTPSGFNFSLPGNLVMYLLMNVLLFGGATMAAGRRNGILKRLAISPATRCQIVMGKVYGNTLLGAAQIIYFLVIGKFLFHVNLGANLPGVILLLVLLAWAAGGLGVFIGSLSAAEDRVIPICVLASILMGALGGCWWPLEMAPPAFKTVALCLPTGWALAGLHQLISFGSGIQTVLLPMAALLGFGMVTNILAIRFFRS